MILGEPKNKKSFICVDCNKMKELHKLGFVPVYRSGEFFYFVKNAENMKVVENGIKK